MKTNTTNDKSLVTPTLKSEYDMQHKANHDDLILIVFAVLFLGLLALLMP